MIKRLEFHISYTCVNDCIFCSESDRMNEFKRYPVNFSEIKKFLITKHDEGFNFVNFTGGEPTLHPNFIEIAKFAKRIGYRIYIGTNGTMLAQRDFCAKASRFLDEISFSVHGYNDFTHDKLVRRKGAFNDIEKAIKNLDKIKFINKFANVVVTEKNFNYLDKILCFLIKNKFKQILFSNTAPEGNGLKNFNKLEVKIDKWQKMAPKLEKISKRFNTSIRFFGLPICALNTSILLSNDFFWDARTTVERGVKKNTISLIEIDSIYPSRNRIKLDFCKNCQYDKICFGFFSEYVKNFAIKDIGIKSDG